MDFIRSLIIIKWIVREGIDHTNEVYSRAAVNAWLKYRMELQLGFMSYQIRDLQYRPALLYVPNFLVSKGKANFLPALSDIGYLSSST